MHYCTLLKEIAQLQEVYVQKSFVANFKNFGMPLVAYCDWNQVGGQTHNCRLFICSSQQQGQEILALTFWTRADRLDFELAINDLPLVSQDELVQVNGDVASSLGGSVVALINGGVAKIQHFNGGPSFSGVKQPPLNKAPGSGIFSWIGSDMKYYVAIVHTKEQARHVVCQKADWLNDEAREPMLAHIDVWNLHPTSEEPMMLIEGLPAELIHWSAIYNRFASGMRGFMN